MSGTAGRWIPHSNRPDALQSYITIPGIKQAPMILLYAVEMLVIILDSPWPVTTSTACTLML